MGECSSRQNSRAVSKPHISNPLAYFFSALDRSQPSAAETKSSVNSAKIEFVDARQSNGALGSFSYVASRTLAASPDSYLRGSIQADPETIDDFLARVIFLGPGITKIVLQSEDKRDSTKSESLR